MKTVAVVDYGMGNLRSVAQAVMHVAQGSGFEVVVTSRPEEVRAAERIVLPGQGAMPDCMRELRESGLQESVLEAAAAKPLFGVCVGMQMLLDRSQEGPDRRPGPDPRRGASNSSWPAGCSPMAAVQGAADGLEPGLADRSRTPCGRACRTAATSISSTATTPGRRMRATASGEADYGTRFTAAIARDNIFATQFHPEKSADQGLALYRNFLHWNP